ncbi:MAG: glutamate 5-kinase [Cellulomonadaceae bacterium]
MTEFAHSRESVARARRVVVKIGSSSLTRSDGRLDLQALRTLVDVLAARRERGDQVVLVTSAAVSAGMGPLGLTRRPDDLATAQAVASVGQGILVARYTEAFREHGLRVGQVLLTVEDTMRRGQYRNAQRALERLLALGVVPVINENDAVATHELRFGDNDRLAAIVSHLVRADAMVLLTDVDGLYDKSPSNPDARQIREVHGPADLAGVQVSGSGSTVGTGGMLTKLESVRIATASGVPVVLTLAENVTAALEGREVGTFFAPTGHKMSRRRLWVGYAAKARGRLVLDDGAVRAVQGGLASLLPAGVTAVEGDFVAGDPIELVDGAGRTIARGLVAYGAAEIPGLLGHSTGELREAFGKGFDKALVHRDDLVLLRRPDKPPRGAPRPADAFAS